MPLMESPERIDYWGDVFVQRGYARYTTFAKFMTAPEKWAQRLEDDRPLLPEQVDVQQRVDALDSLDETIGILEKMERELDHLPRRNGAVVEPLKHHRNHHR